MDGGQETKRDEAAKTTKTTKTPTAPSTLIA
jgi:hypothetical protein